MTNRFIDWLVNPHAHVNTEPTKVRLITSDPEPDLGYIPQPGRTDHDNHEHHLVIIGVQPNGVRQPFQPATTIVLYGCTMCSLVKDSIINGTWEMEKIKDLQTRIQSDPQGTTLGGDDAA